MTQKFDPKKNLKDFLIEDKCLLICAIAIIPALFSDERIWLVYCGCFFVITLVILIKSIIAVRISKKLTPTNSVDDCNNDNTVLADCDVNTRALRVQKNLISINNFYILLSIIILVHIPVDISFICHRSECWDSLGILFEVYEYAITLLPITIAALCLSLITKMRLRRAKFDDQVSSSVHWMIKYDYLFKLLPLLSIVVMYYILRINEFDLKRFLF